MEIPEKLLEDLICLTPKSIIMEKGLDCFYFDEMNRQFNLGVYGRIDILTVSVDPDDGYNFTIYELKKDEIDVCAVYQTCRYLEGLRLCLKEHHGLDWRKYKINCVLIGGKLKNDEGLFFLLQALDNFEVYLYEFDVNGIKFSHMWDIDLLPSTDEDDRGYGDGAKIDFHYLNNTYASL